MPCDWAGSKYRTLRCLPYMNAWGICVSLTHVVVLNKTSMLWSKYKNPRTKHNDKMILSLTERPYHQVLCIVTIYTSFVILIWVSGRGSTDIIIVMNVQAQFVKKISTKPATVRWLTWLNENRQDDGFVPHSDTHQVRVPHGGHSPSAGALYDGKVKAS